jgi:tetratricopeptide (TPR) repeat protein
MEFMVLLENFWVTTDPFEGSRRFEAVLAMEVEVPDRLRARALRCFAGSLFLAGHYERSHRLNEESLALFRALGDDRGVAVLLHRIGISTLQLGDSEKARELLEESRRLFRKVGVARGEAEAIGGLGYVAQTSGDLETATELLSRSAQMAGETGFVWWQVGMLLALVESLVELGRVEEAEASAREGLALARRIGDRQSIVFGLALLAWIASVRGDLTRAGRLWGAVEAEGARAPVGQWEDERETYADKVLGPGGPDLEPFRRDGRGLSLSAAVDEALA